MQHNYISLKIINPNARNTIASSETAEIVQLYNISIFMHQLYHYLKNKREFSHGNNLSNPVYLMDAADIISSPLSKIAV